MAIGSIRLALARTVTTSPAVTADPAVSAQIAQVLDGDVTTVREITSGKIGGVFIVDDDDDGMAFSANTEGALAEVHLRIPNVQPPVVFRGPSHVTSPAVRGAVEVELKLTDFGFDAGRSRARSHTRVVWAQTFVDETVFS